MSDQENKFRRIKIGIYLNLQEHRELKSLCAYLGLSLTHFANLALKDRIKKEIFKSRNNGVIEWNGYKF